MSDPRTAGTPAGWYPDPTDADQLRWWDGDAWQAWQHPARPAQAGARSAQRAWTVIVILVGACSWLLSIGAVLLEDLERDGPPGVDPVKVVGAIGFFAIPVIVAAVVAAIWIVPSRRRRRAAPD